MTKMSDILTQRIAKAEAEITTSEARLVTIVAEKQVVLAAPTIDHKALARLEAEEAKIPVTIESLHTRCTLLAGQVEEALKGEANERQNEIGQEHIELATRINGRREAFLQRLEELMKFLHEDRPDRERWEELTAESEFLRVAYQAACPSVPPIERLEEGDVAALNRQLWIQTAIQSPDSRKWREKTDKIREQRHTEARKKHLADFETRPTRPTAQAF